tara:strand:+ start:232 stop:519 length:288 start_codon:yes stop_codon:yes gene_type:complete
MNLNTIYKAFCTCYKYAHEHIFLLKRFYFYNIIISISYIYKQNGEIKMKLTRKKLRRLIETVMVKSQLNERPDELLMKNHPMVKEINFYYHMRVL